MAENIRRQLTLFLSEPDAARIEQVRLLYNPEQSRLIKSHVTLCREDEIEDIDKLHVNLERLEQKPVVINFGKPTRFANGKGVLIPAEGENSEFHNLRKAILQGLHANPGWHEAHITLMHPRNSNCTDAIFKAIQKMRLPRRVRFKTVSLIEQVDGSAWKTLKTYELRDQT